MTKLIVAFHNFTNAPKNTMRHTQFKGMCFICSHFKLHIALNIINVVYQCS